MTREQIDRAMRNRGCFALVEFELVLDFAIQIHDDALEEAASETALYSPRIIPERIRALKVQP